jgi:1,4-alpha-glucan branching enzyme
MPGLTSPVEDGGLGFNYRLGMGIPDFWIKMLKEYRDEDWSINEMWHVLNDRLPNVKTVTYAESHDQALVGDKTIAFRLMDKEMYFHMQKDDPDLIIERGIALHKLIRLFSISLGGNAYMNFMGNEFGHPEWIDFPREGNGWSYKYCRRLWSLVDNPDLKYQYMDNFDKAMISFVKENKILRSFFGNQLNVDEGNKTIAFERNNLIFLFNFHPQNSIPDYRFPVPKAGEYFLLLNSDDKHFGGHGRINNDIHYRTYSEGKKHYLSVYNTNRTAQVFKRNV